jgi:large subunit ribosomal protein L29
MDAVEIRQLTDDEIQEALVDSKDELARLRYRSAYEDLENPVLLRELRRQIARIKTIQRERSADASKSEEHGDG